MAELKIFSGRANRPLAEKIAEYLQEPLGNELDLGRFSDGEISLNYSQNIRGIDYFIIQSTNSPAENWIELFIMIRAAKTASASRVTAAIPYFGYSRQDRKDRSRAPITARLMADEIITAGADRILTIDLHAAQIQGFFGIYPCDHLYARPTFLKHFRNIGLGAGLTVVAPDVGATGLARAYAQRLNNVPIAIIDKRRPAPNQAEVMNIIGDVAGRDALIVDDIVDTAGTLAEAVKALKKRGANNVYALATHGVLSGKATQRISSSQISKLFITDTIEHPPEKLGNKIEVVSIAPLLGEAIRRIHNNESVSSLFE